MPQSLICPICGNSTTTPQISSGSDIKTFTCLYCGKFNLTGTAETELSKIKLSSNGDSLKSTLFSPSLSHKIRISQRFNETPTVNSDLINEVKDNPILPTPKEAADNFIIYLGREHRAVGRFVEISSNLGALIGVESYEAFYLVINYLVNEGFLTRNSAGLGSDCSLICLTMKGWDRFYELTRLTTVNKTAFMAMEFGDSELDLLVDQHVRQAIQETGFILRRLDDNLRAGLIDDQLRVEIRNCRFLLADLTHANPGAYWEAGFAEGLGKPVIYLCKKDIFENPASRPHFDTNHHLTIVWDSEHLDKAMKKLKACIRATIPEALFEDT